MPKTPHKDNEKLLSIFENKEVKGLETWLGNGGDPNALVANPGCDPSTLLEWLVLDIDGPEDDAPLIEMLALLIGHGADVNLVAKEGDHSILHWVVAESRPVMTKLLLEAGADVDTRTDEGMTPILLAMENGCWESFGLLLQYATPKAVNEWGNFHGRTPLGLAIAEANIMAIDLLLRHGADPFAYEPDEGNAFHNLRHIEDPSLRVEIKMRIEEYRS
jgi:ankyrin repeat protein